MIAAIIYLLIILSAEFVTVFVHPVWGIGIHITILVMALLQSALNTSYAHRPLLLSLTFEARGVLGFRQTEGRQGTRVTYQNCGRPNPGRLGDKRSRSLGTRRAG